MHLSAYANMVLFVLITSWINKLRKYDLHMLAYKIGEDEKQSKFTKIGGCKADEILD